MILRNAGDDGVTCYRIPGIDTTLKGTLIAVYDVRRCSWGDLPGDIDVGMSRSTDGGKTWEPMQVILDMGHDAKWKHDGIGDPCVCVDRRTGTIWVAALWSHGNCGWHGSGPGMKPEETGQAMLVRSDDDGKTWSTPMNITDQIKDPKWRLILPSPGRGMTMTDGTLVFPAQFKDAENTPFSTIMWSCDRGKSWKFGTGAKSNTTECGVVELRDGRLMLNMRDNRGGARSVCTTIDMGSTWQEHPTSRKALIEPVCNAGLIRIKGKENVTGKDMLVFCNPNHKSDRSHMTLKVSVDDGMSWPRRYWLLIDEGKSAGYSSLSQIDTETIGVLYEGSRAHLCFRRVGIQELLGGE
jgi:sialidase-1